MTVELPNDSELIKLKPEQKTHNPSHETESKKSQNDFEKLVEYINRFLEFHIFGINKDLLTYKIGKLSSGESESFVLWLHTKNSRIIIPAYIKNKSLELTISHCDWANGDMGKLGALYLLLSKNAILLLIRLLVLAFLFLCMMWQNPPLNIVTDPLQIKENWTAGEGNFVVISAKNIGCDLFSPILSFPNSSNESFINTKWTPDDLKSGAAKFVNLSVQRNCPPGEYRGSIIIRANAIRIMRILNHTFPIGNTSTMKLAEVPVFIKITPRLNATA